MQRNSRAEVDGYALGAAALNKRRTQAVIMTVVMMVVVSVLATPLVAQPVIEWQFQPATPVAVPAGPALPDFPTQLVVDDGMADGSFGVGGATARQFLWFTQFGLPPGAQNVNLQEIWVLFPAGPNVAAGDAIELVVYQDFDGDPTNGATLLASFDESIQNADGTTFSVYSIPTVRVEGGGEVLIGVVSRFVESGVTPFPTLPAAVDTSVSDGSAWFATWMGDPPNPPELPSDLAMQPLNASFPGVWMIRGFGRPIPDFQVIPTAGTWGLITLAIALALGALMVMRGHAAAVVLVLAVAAMATVAGPAHATDVDDFSVPQAAVAGTLPTPASSSVPAGIGGERDVEAAVLVGAGTTTATGTGSVMEITVSDTTPDTRGEVVLTWDGVDGSPALDPVGLGGVDLTTDGGTVQTGFELLVTATETGVEAMLEVFTDAGNASRIDVVLLATQTSYPLSFTDFVASAGGGADFANVGAIVLTVRANEKAVSVDRLQTTAPMVVGLLVDALAPAGDGDMDGNADPGDTLRYTATISNTGSEADDVDVNNVLSDLTFVGGSVRTTPVARGDRYDDEACGNVTLTVAAAQGVLVNDFDIDTNALAVDVANSDATSVQGGTVTMAADGSFVYEPPAGFGGVDAFDYQLALVAGDPTPPAPIRGTVTVVIDERVWFVDNDHPGTNQGTLANPFQTLVALESVASAGDTIFIFEAPNTTGLDTGLVLEDDQRLIGHGVDLVACGQTLVNASTRPTITHNAGIGITLGENNEIRGLNIGATDARGISGNGFGTATIDEVDLTDAGAEALHLTDGVVAATFGTLSSTTSTTGGLFLDNVGGTLSATSTTVANPAAAGMTIQNLPAGAAHDFGATAVTDTGALGTAGHGVRVANNNATATVTFGTLSISTENGAGFEAPMGGIVDIESTGAVVMANGGAAVNINGTTGRTSGVAGWTFDTLSSLGSPANGVVLTALPVNFTVGTSTAVMDAMGTGILPTNVAGRTISFAATSVMDTNVGSGPAGNAVDLRTGNAGAVFNFASLSVVADGGFGVAANNSGTVNVTGGGSGIAATGGPAVDFNSTTSAVVVASLASTNSTTRGVSLAALPTGSSFAVTGTTNVNNPTDEGVFLASAVGAVVDIDLTGNVTIDNSVVNSADEAIRIDRAGAGSDIDFGDVSVLSRRATGILIDNAEGTIDFGTHTDANGAGAGGHGVRVEDSAAVVGFAALNISNTVQSVATADGGSDGIPDNDADGDAVFLKNTTGGFRANGGTLSNLASDGFDVRNGGGLLLRNMIIEDIGTASGNPSTIPDAGLFARNLNGANVLENTVIRRAQTDEFDEHVRIKNDGTTVDELRLSNVDISNTTAGSSGDIRGANGFLFEAAGTMDATVIVENDSDATGIRLVAWNFLIGDGGGGSGDIDIVVDDSTLDPNGLSVFGGGLVVIGVANDIQIGIQDSFTVDYTFMNNTIQDVQLGLSQAGVISNNATGSANVTGRIVGNTINDIRGRRGINLIAQSTLASYSVTVDSNQIDDLANETVSGAPLFTAEALGMQIKDTVSGGQVRVLGNRFGTITPVADGSAQEAMFLQTQDSATAQVLMHDNEVVVGAGGSDGIEVDIEDNTNISLTVQNNGRLSAESDQADEDAFDATTEDPGSTLCLDLDNNTANPATQELDLNESDGTFTVEDVATDNVGVLVADAGITTGAADCARPSGVVLAASGRIAQMVTTNAAFASLDVTVKNDEGAPAAGVTVTFTAPGAGASGTFPGGATCVTNGAGQCGVAFTANGTEGAYQVRATASGAERATFYLRNLP